MKIKIPKGHPRAESLRIRERLIEEFEANVVATAGLIAHGRGEAFDYLMRERTPQAAIEAIRAATALLLTCETPVISVNGNTAALSAKEIVELANCVNARIEVNLFYRTAKRERAIKKLLEKAGARTILGVDRGASAHIRELGSKRRLVDKRGILAADVVLVPLEDGDRTEALVKIGKKIIAIDLNPLSRTSQQASITIVDNIVRAMPLLVEKAKELRKASEHELEGILARFDNAENLGKCIDQIRQQLAEFAAKGKFIDIGD